MAFWSSLAHRMASEMEKKSQLEAVNQLGGSKLFPGDSGGGVSGGGRRSDASVIG